MNPQRVLAVLGWLIALAVLVVVGWVAPDSGLTSRSLWQGLALSAVFAVVPTGVWLWGTRPDFLVAAGGAWFVAGAITSQGGNTLMLAAVVYGLAVLLVGANKRPMLTWGLAGLLVLAAAALAAAVFLASSVTV